MDLATLLNQPVRLQQSTWSESCHSRKFPRQLLISRERGLEGIGRLPILQAQCFGKAFSRMRPTDSAQGYPS